MAEPIPGESPTKKAKVEQTELQQLKEHTLVVADTGDFTQI